MTRFKVKKNPPLSLGSKRNRNAQTDVRITNNSEQTTQTTVVVVVVIILLFNLSRDDVCARCFYFVTSYERTDAYTYLDYASVIQSFTADVRATFRYGYTCV